MRLHGRIRAEKLSLHFHLTRLGLLALAISIICLLAFPVEASHSSFGALVDLRNPGAYITRGQAACHQSGALRLVFHNNYRFPVIITLISSESGDAKPAYEIVADENGKSRVVERFEQEVSTAQPIKSEGQLSLCVVARDISSSRYIKVPFKIDGESDTVQAAAPEHFALFYGDATH